MEELLSSFPLPSFTSHFQNSHKDITQTNHFFSDIITGLKFPITDVFFLTFSLAFSE